MIRYFLERDDIDVILQSVDWLGPILNHGHPLYKLLIYVISTLSSKAEEVGTMETYVRYLLDWLQRRGQIDLIICTHHQLGTPLYENHNSLTSVVLRTGSMRMVRLFEEFGVDLIPTSPIHPYVPSILAHFLIEALASFETTVYVEQRCRSYYLSPPPPPPPPPPPSLPSPPSPPSHAICVSIRLFLSLFPLISRRRRRSGGYLGDGKRMICGCSILHVGRVWLWELRSTRIALIGGMNAETLFASKN
jgi:hypothetical protein